MKLRPESRQIVPKMSLTCRIEPEFLSQRYHAAAEEREVVLPTIGSAAAASGCGWLSLGKANNMSATSNVADSSQCPPQGYR